MTTRDPDGMERADIPSRTPDTQPHRPPMASTVKEGGDWTVSRDRRTNWRQHRPGSPPGRVHAINGAIALDDRPPAP